MRWLGPHPRRALATPEEARERLGRWHDRERALDPPLGLWAIVPLISRTEPRAPVGTILLVPLADASGPTGLMEIGWHLHPRQQGQGFATEAGWACATKARPIAGSA
jgi:RimJ/RimL family protein N-acetyltransferase